MAARIRALIVALCGLIAAGCASAPPSADALAANDPYEATNRQILELNNKFDRYSMQPTLDLYFAVVPEGGRRGIHNFLGNLSKPTIFVNDVLQGELPRGSQTAGRFLVNSTLGLGGLFDPASKIGIPDHGEDVPRLAKNKILIDADPETKQRKLLQIFTQNNIGPIFFEIIQRKGNEGFGEGNFTALFESIERDQMRRGVL